MAESNELLKLIRQQTEAAAQSTAQVAAASQKAASESAVMAEQNAVDQEKLGTAKSLVTRTLQTGTMIAQEESRKAVDAAGGMDTLYGIISQLATTTKRVQGELQAVREEQLSTTGFSPLGALKLALDVSGNRTRLEQSMTELKVMSDAATSLEQRLSQAGNIAKSSARTITNASIAASAEIVETEAAIQARNARLDGLKYNLAGIQAAAQADDKILALAVQEANFARAEAQFQHVLEEADARRAERKVALDLRIEAQREKLDNLQMEARTIEYINLGEAARGLPPSTSQEIRDHIRLNKGIGKEYEELYQNGRIAAKTGQALISTSPAKVAGVLAADPSIIEALDAQQKKVANLVLQAAQVLNRPENRAAASADKTGQTAQRLVTQEVQTRISQQLQLVGNNPDNLFYIGEPSSYIGTKEQPGVSSFQKYPLVQKVFNPAIESGISLADVSVPFKLAVEAVKAGELSSSQAAADFSNVYKRMAALQRAGADFKKFAIALPPDGSTYRVNIDGQVVDVTDFVQVATAMNRQLARQAFSDYRTGKRINPGLAKEMQKNLPQGFPNE